MNGAKKYSIIGIAIHIAGFALGFAGQGSIQLGLASIDSGIAILEPSGDLLYGLGLVIVVASASRPGLSMKYLVIAGVVIGIGFFLQISDPRDPYRVRPRLWPSPPSACRHRGHNDNVDSSCCCNACDH